MIDLDFGTSQLQPPINRVPCRFEGSAMVEETLCGSRAASSIHYIKRKANLIRKPGQRSRPFTLLAHVALGQGLEMPAPSPTHIHKLITQTLSSQSFTRLHGTIV
jgi:hypothetical protein